MPDRPKPSRWLLLALPPLALAGVGIARTAHSEPQPTPQAKFEQSAKPLLTQYCGNCHGPQKGAGGINLARFTEVTAIQKDQTTWRKVLHQLRDRAMPPRNAPQPSTQQRELLVEWLTQTLDNVDEGLLEKNPGRVLIHRLSRAEYNNTVRDLLGVTSRPADQFPADGGGGGGFDNNADTLFIPPILMERYLSAAGEIVRDAPKERIFFLKPSKKLPARTVARKILSFFSSRGFRRPVEPAELNGLMRLYDQSIAKRVKHEDAVRYALKAVLVSPSFLFRVEKDQPSAEPYLVNDYELASRLSYFLWSSMPDDELFKLAGTKRLHDPKVLDAQITRMLKDPKADAFAESFVGQWLRIRELQTSAQPDPRRFPMYTPSLRDAMYQETVQFFGSVLRENRSLLTLLDADYTYLNEELARHYGVDGVKGPELRRVSLTDKNRGGMLTMASVLTITSYPQRTSPVLRGKWVLEEMLGVQVPPPPPNAGGLPADDAPKAGQTFRQRLELHRQKPECASCHSRMDPIGFGLENFDAVGRWRTKIGTEAVDASAVMPTGEKFQGAGELKQIILARKDEFARNVTEKMLAYSLGRGLEPYDIPTVRRITRTLAEDGYRSETLVREIVKSYPFQYRKNL
jgi:hypothetical protein